MHCSTQLLHWDHVRWCPRYLWIWRLWEQQLGTVLHQFCIRIIYVSDFSHMNCYEQWAQLSVKGRWMCPPSWTVISWSVVMERVSFLFLTVGQCEFRSTIAIPTVTFHIATICNFHNFLNVGKYRLGCIHYSTELADRILQRSFCSSMWRIAGGHVKPFWSFPRDMEGASQPQDP